MGQDQAKESSIIYKVLLENHRARWLEYLAKPREMDAMHLFPDSAARFSSSFKV
ncbi:MAG: hypothetical protein ACE5H0_10210 [Bacteroidota bacterium]